MTAKTRNPRKRKIIFIAISTVAVILVTVVYFRYYFVYSEGTRVGILYKFSKKGTFFKTYEGEMMLPGLRTKDTSNGLSSNLFRFSVDDETLAKELMNSQGMELELHYTYFNRPLPWRGDSYEEEKGQYIVDKLVRIKDKNPNGYGL